MHDAHTALSAAMPERATPLPLRSDTILGVCEALGEDFGFNPLWLRVSFASLLLFFPIAVVGTYFGLGALVAGSRLLYPNRVAPAAALASEQVAPSAATEEQAESLPLAA